MINWEKEINRILWKQERERHYKSPEWYALKVRVIEKRSAGLCEWHLQEGYKVPAAELHHLTYKRFGHELLEDVVHLCRQCHDEENKA